MDVRNSRPRLKTAPECAMVAAVTLPVLAAAESAMCLWLWSRAGTPSSFGWHGGALFVAIWAEVVFMVARSG